MNTLTVDQGLVTQELGELVKELFKSLYDCCFIGELKVNILENGYLVLIGMPTLDRPFSIAADLPWDSFLEYLKKNLRSTSLQEWFRYTLKIEQPNSIINGTK